MNVEIDEMYMKEALRLAKNGKGRVSPNPMVGAVIVKDGRIVGAGWHRKAGTPHAEIHAINMAGELAKGATLYVTLEPCAHIGRTEPCTVAIINAGISRVVMALLDPNPKVCGNGYMELKKHGISTELGVLEAEAYRLNEIFFKWIKTNEPFVNLKMAMTLDGKIATKTGESKWITGEESRKKAHELRDSVDAVIVGIGTVLADNPSLTARIPEIGVKNPIRIILDSNAKIPLNSNVLVDNMAKTIVAVTKKAPMEKVEAIKNTGAEVLVLGDNRVDIKELLKTLGEREITSVLVEGGGEVHYSFISENFFDRVYAFIAPKILGGALSKSAVAGEGFQSLQDAVKLCNVEISKLGEDILITGDRAEVRHCLLE